MTTASRRTLLLLSHLFVAATAIWGGAVLLRDPSGAKMGLPAAWLATSPFQTYLIPGLVLAFLVGGSAGIAAAAQLGRLACRAKGSIFAGAMIAGWIAVELAMVRHFSGLQVLYLGLGALQLSLGLLPEAPVRLPGMLAEQAERFFNHRRIALVGYSSKAQDFSRAVASEMEKRGLEVVGVNARAANPGNPPVYPSVSAIPDPPRAVLLMVPPSAAAAVIADCAKAGVEAVWFHRGAGSPGSASPEAVALAKRAGMAVITDACPLMFLEPVGWFHRVHRGMRLHGHHTGAAA